MKFFFNLLKPKEATEPYDPAPATNQAVSALFVAGVAVLVALYSTTTLRCSTQENQVGCQAMNSVKDCDNLLLASCTTQCGGTPYYYCDGALSKHLDFRWYEDSVFDSQTGSTTFLGTWKSTKIDGSTYLGSSSSSPSRCPTTSVGTCLDSDVSWAVVQLSGDIAPPTDAATCKKYYSDLESAKKNVPGGLAAQFLTQYEYYLASWASSTTLPPDWPSKCSSTGTPSCFLGICSGISWECGESKPRVVTEALGRCCGVLKSTQICLSPQATVGVLGGYISLWMSICQAIYSGLVLLYDFSGGKKKKESADAKQAESADVTTTSPDPNFVDVEVYHDEHGNPCDALGNPLPQHEPPACRVN